MFNIGWLFLGGIMLSMTYIYGVSFFRDSSIKNRIIVGISIMFFWLLFADYFYHNEILDDPHRCQKIVYTEGICHDNKAIKLLACMSKQPVM